MDNKVPGGVYLCQVDEQISCGACCGLYNVEDASYANLMEMLTCRTEAFAKVPRNMDAILVFKQAIEDRELQRRPFPEFHHCPYIGLVGKARSRVGCLLHPLAEGNNGVDFRGLSFYGGMACRIYFCLSCHNLQKAYKEIVREVSEDWYLYGLIITEVEMLNAFFQELEKRLEKPIRKEDIIGNQRRMETVRDFFALKLDWPFRSRPGTGLCNYFFEDQLYPKPPLNYEAIGTLPSRYDTILRELLSSFDSPDELHRAEALLDRIFARLVR